MPNSLPISRLGSNVDILPLNAQVLSDYELRFIGSITDEGPLRGICKKDGSEVRTQKAFGTLSLIHKNTAGEEEEIISVSAISGDGGNGCIPNNILDNGKVIKYYVGKLESPYIFNDGVSELINGNWVTEPAHTWKITIYENIKERGSFRIHPTRKDFSDFIMPNDGCISPYIPDEVVLFYETMKSILTTTKKVIPLFVTIDGNDNITVQIKNYARLV